MIGTANPRGILVVMDRFLNLRNTVTPYLTGRPFRGDAVPGNAFLTLFLPDPETGICRLLIQCEDGAIGARE
jgi:hypothetical protein